MFLAGDASRIDPIAASLWGSECIPLRLLEFVERNKNIAPLAGKLLNLLGRHDRSPFRRRQWSAFHLSREEEIRSCGGSGALIGLQAKEATAAGSAKRRGTRRQIENDSP
jgi:hypothetical protein